MPLASFDELFRHVPRIETPRLILRQIDLSDAEAIFATFSDEQVMEFYGEAPHRSVEDSRELIRRQQHWYAERGGIRWGITRRGSDIVIGSCGMFNFDDEFRRAEIGYELGQAYWRQGIMAEALGVLVAYAFETLAMHRLEAVVDDGNARSRGLLLHLGFAHEGTLRQRFYFRERYWDEHYFGLLREQWIAQRAS